MFTNINMYILFVSSLAMVAATERLLFRPKPELAVTCSDKSNSCPAYNTCCRLSYGKYGCCQLPNAVCCEDGKHCCPQATTCGMDGECYRDRTTVTSWFKRQRALPGTVTCPDGHSECKTGMTCCKLPTGDFSCCPVLKAVCCSDGQHCCPHGQTCDLSAGVCRQGNLVVMSLVRKLPAFIKLH